MAVRTISTEISLSGEKAFNDQMKAINSNLKTLKSDMKLVSAEFDANGTSVVNLQAKQSVLQQQYDQQTEKVRALREMMERAAAAYGENSSQADKYRQQLNDAIVVQADFANKLDATTEALNKAKNPLSGVTSALDDLVKADVDKLLHPLEGVKERLQNISADDIRSGLQNLKGKVGEVWDTIKTAPIDVLQGAAGALIDMTKAVYEQTVASAAYADDILTLATNTGLSTDALQEYKYMAQLTDTSLETITGSMVKLTANMDKARDKGGDAAAAFERLGIQITKEDGSLRSNQEVFAEAIDALGQMEEGTERDALSMDLFGKKAQDLNSLIAAGSDGIAAYAQEARDAGAVLSGDTLAALGAVDDSVQRFNGTLEAVKTALGAEFAEPVADIMTGLTEIMRGNVDEGMQMITDGLDKAIEIVDELLPEAEEFLRELLNKFIDRMPELLTTGTELIIHLINGIATAMPEIIPQMMQAILTMVQTLTAPENLSQLVSSGIELIIQLAIGLAQAIPELIPALLEAVGTIVQTIWDHRGDIVEAGKDLIRGLWEGIKAMGAWLWDQVSGFFGNLVGNIKASLGIASPSRVTRDQVGRNLALGVGEGFTETMNDVNKEMQDAINTDFSLTPNVALQRGLADGQNYGAAEARADMQQITAGMVNGLQTAFSGAQSAPSSINVNLTLPDGTSILRYFIDLSRANGTPIANPV